MTNIHFKEELSQIFDPATNTNKAVELLQENPDLLGMIEYIPWELFSKDEQGFIEKFEKKIHELHPQSEEEEEDIEKISSTFQKMHANTVKTVHSRNRTALMIACEHEDLDLVKELLEADADVNANNNDKESPLMIAILTGNTKIVEMLLDKRANIESKNKLGQTPLMIAILKNNAELLEMLLDRRANIEAANKLEQSPLVVAVLEGNLKIIKILLKEHANVNATDLRGYCVLDRALHSRYWEVAAILIAHGAVTTVANPLELCLVCPGSVEDLQEFFTYLKTYLPKEQFASYFQEMQTRFPERFFLSKSKLHLPLPEKLEIVLPEEFDTFTLEDAEKCFRECMAHLNFTDHSRNGFISQEKILDQGKRITAEQLQKSAEQFLRVIKDMNASKFSAERGSSEIEKRQQEYFRIAMYGIFLAQKKQQDPSTSPEKHENIKKSIDHQIMLIAASGNHCYSAKMDTLKESIGINFTIKGDSSFQNTVRQKLYTYRLGVIEQLFTTPEGLYSHQMEGFKYRHTGELGLIREDLIEDPFFLYDTSEDQTLMQKFCLRNTRKRLISTLQEEIETKDSKILPDLVMNFLRENMPQDWNIWDEFLLDTEHMDLEATLAYLENYYMGPTPDEIAELSCKEPLKKELQDAFLAIEKKLDLQLAERKKMISLEIAEKENQREEFQANSTEQITLSREIKDLQGELGYLQNYYFSKKQAEKQRYLKDREISLNMDPKQLLAALKEMRDFKKVADLVARASTEEEALRILEKNDISINRSPVFAFIFNEREAVLASIDATTAKCLEELTNEADPSKVLEKHQIQGDVKISPKERLENWRKSKRRELLEKFAKISAAMEGKTDQEQKEFLRKELDPDLIGYEEQTFTPNEIWEAARRDQFLNKSYEGEHLRKDRIELILIGCGFEYAPQFQ